MSLNITAKLLHIPPYLSTAWDQVASLRMEHIADLGDCLVVTLKDHTLAKIPSLNPATIELIFSKYHDYLSGATSTEKKDPSAAFSKLLFPPNMAAMSEWLGTDQGSSVSQMPSGHEMIQLSNTMQHNPAQSGMPDLPAELLEKIVTIAKVIGVDEGAQLIKAEPHCNCLHCQLARALRGEQKEDVSHEEEVKDEELQFRSWDIQQIDEHLYHVTHPLDAAEKYTVFLGSPVGCTCGQKGCEHINAVLNS